MKRIMIMACILILSMSGSAFGALLKGDLNNNSSIDLGDTIYALMVLCDIDVDLPTEVQAALNEVDVDGDVKIGMEEAVYSLECVAGFRDGGGKTSYGSTGLFFGSGLLGLAALRKRRKTRLSE